MTRKILIPLFLLAGCTQPTSTGVVGSQQNAIIGGTTDTGDTSVVMVYAEVSSTQAAICTGEVVSPHMVLTAAHCVDPAVLGTSTAKFAIFLGSDANNATQQADATNWIDVVSTDFDPQFDSNQLGNGHDIGEVTVGSVIPRGLLPINTTPLGPSAKGKTVRVVGYGISSGTDTSGTSAGTKRQVSTTINDADGELIYFGNATKNTCEGDSGGPAFLTINSVETIVGITSFGDQGCTQGGYDTDVAAYYTSFIQPHITAAESGTTTGSTPDLGGGTTTPTDPDMATTTTTGGNDGGTTTTPATTGTQLGGTCSDSSDCESGICTQGAHEYCTQSCELDVESSCPSNMHCQLVSGAPYCVLPEKSKGCSAAGTGSAPTSAAGSLGSVLLLLGVAGFLRFARRLN